MKLRRVQTPAIDPEIARIAAALFGAYEDDREACERLAGLRLAGAPASEVRREALIRARWTAVHCRAAFDAIAEHRLDDALQERWLPYGALHAVARLVYTLVALAEDDPEPEAMLTQTELENLTAQYQLDAWVAVWENTQ